MEAACARALAVGEYRYHTVKTILAHALVIDERYEKASVLLASNRDRAEWPDLFGEPLLASAALDRLTHGAHFVEITGASFRAEHTKKQTATRRGRAAN